MSREAPFVINLEITVPHIVLPAAKQRRRAVDDLSAAHENETSEELQLLAAGVVQPLAITSASTEHVAHTRKFRLFHLQLPAVSKPFLLQVLRRSNEEGEPGEKHAGYYVADVSTFALAFLPTGGDAEAPSTPPAGDLHARLKRVVIYLDHEGTATNYRIDGAES